MAKKGVLSALTTIGYGLVFLVVVIVGAVLVQIGIYGLGEKDEAIVGLEISSTELNSNNILNVVTNDTSKQLSLSILGNADLEGGAVEQSSVVVRLSIKNSLGTALTANNRPVNFVVLDENGDPVLDAENNIQTTDTVDVGINDTFKLALATYKATNTLVADAEEATYIKGGTCYIEAYSIDGRFKAQRIEVNVDVPVETIKVTVIGYNKSGVMSDLTNIINNTVDSYDEATSLPTATSANLGLVVLYTGETGTWTNNTYYKCVQGSTAGSYIWQATDMQYFIKNDQLELGIQAFPANSLQAVSSMHKIIQYLGETFNSDYASLSADGILVVNGETEETTGPLTIQAKVLKNYGGTEYVDAFITINTAKLEIESITIGNEDVKDGGVSILVGQTLQFSATSSASTSGISGLINLNVIIRSKHYTHGVDPLAENLAGLVMHIVDNHTTEVSVPEGYVNVSSINSGYRSALLIENTTQLGNENNIKWELLAKRQLITNETIDLYIAEYNSQSSAFNPDNPYAHVSISISTTEPSTFSYTGEDTLSIVKYDGGMTGTDVEDVIDLTSGFISYTTAGSQSLTYTKWVYFLEGLDEDENINTNLTGSPIIEISATGQIKRTEGNTVQYSETLSGLGNGTVRIRAYLVRTNSSGQPLDCYYNVITQGDSTGFVLQDASDLMTNAANVGQYVVEYSASEYFTVTVEEMLDLTNFYYDKGLTLLVSDPVIPSEMGTTLDNVKYIYLQGNSIYALLNEYSNITVGKEVTQIDESLVVASIDGEPVIETDETTGYYTKVYLKIQLISAQANTFRIYIEDNGTPINEMYFEAKDVQIETMQVDWTDMETARDAIEQVNGVNVMTLSGVLSGNSVSWYYWTGTDNVTFQLPYNVIYTYNIVGAEQCNTVLKPLNEITLAYKVYALSDAELLQAVAGTLNWSDDLLCGTVSAGQVFDAEGNLTGIRLLLSEGWDAETDNLILMYEVTSSDGETATQFREFYELSFYGDLPVAVWSGTAITQFNSSNYTAFGAGSVWDVAIDYGETTYAWISADYSAYMSMSLTDNSASYDINDYLYLENGLLKVKAGYIYSASDNANRTNVLNNNSTFKINYILYGSNGIVYEKIMTVTLVGFIEQTS